MNTEDKTRPIHELPSTVQEYADSLPNGFQMVIKITTGIPGPRFSVESVNVNKMKVHRKKLNCNVCGVENSFNKFGKYPIEVSPDWICYSCEQPQPKNDFKGGSVENGNEITDALKKDPETDDKCSGCGIVLGLCGYCHNCDDDLIEWDL